VTEPKDKPVLDQQTFEKLLEAAHVLQEHNRKLRDLEAIMEAERRRDRESASEAARPKGQPESDEAARSNGDYTLTLAQIVEAQRQIQMRNLELDQTMAVVAERAAHITGASGAGVGILDGKKVRYRAGTGASALPEGSEVSLKSAICAASVRTGQVIRSEDVNTEVLFDPEPCRQRGIRSLVAVPIYQDGGIVGGLELYFDKIHGYAEQDIHTCQLMAGLLTEALGREADQTLKKSMAAERTSMLAAIEKLRPNVAASEKNKPAVILDTTTDAHTAAKSFCGKCGNALLPEEQFCGTCGSSQAAPDDESRNMQSDLAAGDPVHEEIRFPGAAQYTQHAEIEPPELESVRLEHEEAAANPPVLVSVPELEQTEPVGALALAANADQDAMALSSPHSQAAEHEQAKEKLEEKRDNDETDPGALIKPQREDIVWTSAARARDFLESLTVSRDPGALARFWQSRRGDFYLAIAVVLVVIVIRWGIWSNQPTIATGGKTSISANRRRPDPDANLSAFDKLLIGLGLAEAPEEAPEYKGNPDTQVWLDLQTALYYCPGSDLYGKTPKGKLASQRDAQLDQFEPAYRKACN
jgi:putative methionine-R-sulfoxide reductase with GAF domain